MAVDTVEIIVSDQPGRIFFNPSSVQVDEKAGEISIGVTHSGAAIGSARVQYFTMDDVAASGSDPITGQNDFVAIPLDPAHQLEWADGETGTRYFSVQINAKVYGKEAALGAMNIRPEVEAYMRQQWPQKESVISNDIDNGFKLAKDRALIVADPANPGYAEAVQFIETCDKIGGFTLLQK